MLKSCSKRKLIIYINVSERILFQWICLGLSTKPLSDLGHSKRSFMISLKVHLERKNVKYAPHGEQYTVSLHEWISHNILTQMWNEALNVGAPCLMIVFMLFCVATKYTFFIHGRVLICTMWTSTTRNVGILDKNTRFIDRRTLHNQFYIDKV